MRIELDEYNNIVLKEVYNGILLETSEGNRIGICMRDDTFEINVMPVGKVDCCWQRVNMQTRNILRMYNETVKVDDPDRGEEN